MSQKNQYELVIIGAGPAGLAGSIYASRYAINHLVVGGIMGGQISETHLIDNYPGIEDVTGLEFSQKWVHHVQKYGKNILTDQVKNIQKNKKYFWEVEMESGKKIFSKALLLATGSKRRKINLSQKEDFIGKGVSYCATCDGFFYKNKTVGVIGGSDSAVVSALYLANIAQKVYLIYRKKQLRCEPHWRKMVEKNKKIEIIYQTNVIGLEGEGRLEKIKLDQKYKEKKELILEGLFIEIGSLPNFDYAQNLKIDIDDGGYIKIRKDGTTSVEGVWAAGDITDGSNKLRQVITAASEGVIAVKNISEWLKKE